MPRRLLPHPFPTDDHADDPRTEAVQTMTWRARRDACRTDAEIAAMSPGRRERARAVREAAARMLMDAGTSPMGRVWAARIVARVPVDPDRPDWAERHRARERERMRRRRAAGDAKLREEVARKRALDRERGGRQARKRAEREREARHSRGVTEAAAAAPAPWWVAEGVALLAFVEAAEAAAEARR